MTLLTLDLESNIYEEIRSELARMGRRDLLDKLHEAVDPDWKQVRRPKHEPLSDEEGSASSESDLEVEIDEDGFYSLK
tara:strand:- start:316 stop:549 length:234 start_codon:yes stop_codon:yes gene_type:complete